MYCSWATNLGWGDNPALVLGRTVWCQYWYRDPRSASTTGLTDGLVFTILP